MYAVTCRGIPYINHDGMGQTNVFTEVSVLIAGFMNGFRQHSGCIFLGLLIYVRFIDGSLILQFLQIAEISTINNEVCSTYIAYIMPACNHGHIY